MSGLSQFIESGVAIRLHGFDEPGPRCRIEDRSGTASVGTLGDRPSRPPLSDELADPGNAHVKLLGDLLPRATPSINRRHHTLSQVQ
jgi:hypothetical protein